MPFIRLETNQRLTEEKRGAVCAALSRACAETLRKPERYVMSVVQDGATMLLGGAPGPAAFVEVRSIGGVTPQGNQALAERVCRVLAETLEIPGNRVYLNVFDVPGENWGFDGSTFG